MVLAFGVSAQSAQSQTPKGWKLIWQENFNKLDPAVWSKIPRNTAAWGNYMSDYDSLYAIQKGNLILRGIVNTTQKNDTAEYLTGGVYTQDKKVFGLGRIEIRAKLGSAQGYWPAFWLLPAKAQWPNGGEIDIMEHLNHDKIVYQTIHNNYTLKLKIKNPKPYTDPKYIPNEYNIYGVELHQDSLCFFLNGVKTLTYPRLAGKEKDGQFPFADQPFYLLLDSQLGGDWVGPIDPAQLPVEMAIDWVKYYEKK